MPRATTRKDKEAKYFTLQQHISNELPYFSLFFQNRATLTKKDVYGDFTPQVDNIFNGIENWFINTVKAQE